MTDTSINDLVERMARTRDGNQRLIEALATQNDALDAAMKVLNGDAPPPAPTPAPKPAPKETRVRAKSTRSINYQEIADWINTAKANGNYSVQALAVAFNKPESAVKNWPGRCKQLGLLTVEIRNVHKPQPAPTARREFTLDDAHKVLAK